MSFSESGELGKSNPDNEGSPDDQVALYSWEALKQIDQLTSGEESGTPALSVYVTSLRGGRFSEVWLGYGWVQAGIGLKPIGKRIDREKQASGLVIGVDEATAGSATYFPLPHSRYAEQTADGWWQQYFRDRIINHTPDPNERIFEKGGEYTFTRRLIKTWLKPESPFLDPPIIFDGTDGEVYATNPDLQPEDLERFLAVGNRAVSMSLNALAQPANLPQPMRAMIGVVAENLAVQV
jgi:hypothetical protein